MAMGRRRGLAGGEKTLVRRLALIFVFGASLQGAVHLLPVATATTTGSDTTSNSGDDGVTGSYYGNGSSSSSFYSACGSVAERCVADSFCVDCSPTLLPTQNGGGDDDTDDDHRDDDDDDDGDDDDGDSAADDDDDDGEVVSSETCSTRYPTLVSDEDLSFCRRVGTAMCCELSDNGIASACLDDPVVAEIWECFLSNEIGCSISDVPCHASYDDTAATTSPTAGPMFETISPTSAPTATPTATAVTPEPTAGATSVAGATFMPTAGSRGGLVAPTPTPAALVDDDTDNDDLEAGGASSGTGVLAGRCCDTAVLATGAVVVVISAISSVPGSLLGLM